MKNWTKEELSLQEEKELNIQAYFSAIGDIKGTTKLLPSNEEYKKLYKELVEMIPNLIKSDSFILASIVSNMVDFKFFNELLIKYKESGNIEAYLSIVKVKNSTSNSILAMLKQLGLTPSTRKNIHILFDPEGEENNG
ncbi:P27 family phage terminase small subunit [uncultured Clostridium sp.]|uniref:P27 family phage terminase small subunit n=1 Tax=uncultured Clostridium sp. TaxID=59620 RepID=UPI0025F14786|nr:P27 family phage terminase small subunit [uncultured Clostridium sp.]